MGVDGKTELTKRPVEIGFCLDKPDRMGVRMALPHQGIQMGSQAVDYQRRAFSTQLLALSLNREVDA